MQDGGGATWRDVGEVSDVRDTTNIGGTPATQDGSAINIGGATIASTPNINRQCGEYRGGSRGVPKAFPQDR